MLKAALYHAALFAIIYGVAIEAGPFTAGAVVFIVAYLGAEK